MKYIYTKRAQKAVARRDYCLHGIKPGGFLRHIDEGGETVCMSHRDTPQWEDVPRSEVRRDCPRCFHLKGLKTREERDA